MVPGLAAAADAGRYALARLHHADADPRKSAGARNLQQAMEEAWAAKNELLDRGVPREFALYLLPNAKAIRLVESGSLLHLLHKWTMRTCFNAQEEIYQASIEEVQQVRAAFPAAGPLHRAAVPSARGNFDSDLHRRLALLRRESLAGFSQYRTADLKFPLVHPNSKQQFRRAEECAQRRVANRGRC